MSLKSLNNLKNIMKFLYFKFLRYFLSGIFIVVPLYFTVGLCIYILKKIDDFLAFGLPGFGIIFLVLGSTLVGYVASRYIVSSISNSVKNVLSKIPIVNIIYKASGDVLGSFVGEKKTLRQAVLVAVNKPDGIYKLGFLTQESLDEIGLKAMVSVYILKPYSLFGDLLIVEKDKIEFLDAPASTVTKFVISGGFSESS